MWGVLVGLVLLWSSGAAVDVSCKDETGAAVDVSCKNENNSDVDWYILYKAPKIGDLTGLKYIYIDSTGNRTMSKPINDSDGVLANTLRPMLSSVRNMPDSFGFLSYSDQPPGCSTDDKFGHSKGVVLGDSGTKTALWLTHSTPQFLFKRDQNKFYPASGDANAQTFMCVTLGFSELSKVGKHLQHIRALPFDQDLPIDFPKELRDAVNWDQKAPSPQNVQELKTRGNKRIKIISKKVHDPDTEEEVVEGDLYVQLAAVFNSDIKAQTWGGQKRDEDFCEINRKQVLNVMSIRTDLGVWATGSDHSKWAVTTTANIFWTCIGDMNRVCSQYKRRGGALCIQDESVNRFFKGFGSTEICKSASKKRKCDSDDEMEIF